MEMSRATVRLGWKPTFDNQINFDHLAVDAFSFQWVIDPSKLSEPSLMSDSYFDDYASSYDEDLGKALSISGEDKHFFAHGRMAWLAKWLQSHGASAKSVLDFGCGTGSSTPFIKQCLNPREITGVDVSADSLRIARDSYGGKNILFSLIGEPARGRFDLAFCNGVFHHIAPAERQSSLAYVMDALRPGGVFALFENNPWNPATLYVMSRCAFDKDAITLSPRETRQRMKQAGFRILGTRFLFIFPALLKVLRPLEAPLSALPFGTQYCVVGQKP
jgi:SAM-dependent methyltransferase